MVGVAALLLTVACGATADLAAPAPESPNESPQMSRPSADTRGALEDQSPRGPLTTASTSPSLSPTLSMPLDPPTLLDEQQGVSGFRCNWPDTPARLARKAGQR